MKNITSLLFLSICFFSCDPVYIVDFIIENQTDQELTLATQYHFQDSTLHNTIGPDNKIIIFNLVEIGSSTEGYLDQLNILPFKEIEMSIPNSIYQKDPLLIENWQKMYPGDRNGIGRVVLTVTDEDFQ